MPRSNNICNTSFPSTDQRTPRFPRIVVSPSSRKWTEVSQLRLDRGGDPGWLLPHCTASHRQRFARFLRPSLPAQRLGELGQEHTLEIIRRDRTDELEGDAAVAADHECLRHAVDAPFDRGAAVLIRPGGRERIAVAVEKAAGVVGMVLVIDADEADA